MRSMANHSSSRHSVSGEGSGEACDVSQKNAYGKDGVDEVAAEAAQVAANLEASRVKGSMNSFSYEDDKTTK
eukprot:scaffold133630_cov39-Tisochrysis_lutea.AAC.2